MDSVGRNLTFLFPRTERNGFVIWWVEGGVTPNYSVLQADFWIVWPDEEDSVYPDHSRHFSFHSPHPLFGTRS